MDPAAPPDPPTSHEAATAARAHSDAGAGTPPGGPADLAELPPGERLDRYVVREKIGEGGFAVVYAAEQIEPVRRPVAIKILKLGMDTRAIIARFEAERQALAMMDHPNVAHVFDAGATGRGRPYFVMELVHGEPITGYCDRHRLRNDERLSLFIQACEAVQHAHQKGIIHRDIKPSNVLVASRGGTPVVKVIDFGVAKALNARLTEATVYTEHGQLIGTPEYMSPEQAEMSALDIDTRSDVYSLGVLLYELLVGELPFDARRLRSAGYAEIQRIIREEEPRKPSTRLSTVGDRATRAERRRVDAGTLIRALRGDMDWITMRALEKDRSRRYESVGGLVADLRHHLAHEPVSAGPPSAMYRARKFARRNRAMVAGLGGVFLALLLGVAGTTWGLMRAVAATKNALEQESLARAEAERAGAIARFVQEMVTGIDPDSADGADTAFLNDMLDRAAARLDGDLLDQPLVRATLYGSIGRMYHELGVYSRARPSLERSLALFEEAGALDGDGAVQSMVALADGSRMTGEPGAGEAYSRMVLDRLRERFDQAMAERGLRDLGTARHAVQLAKCLWALSRLDEASEMYLRASEGFSAVNGPDDREAVSARKSAGSALTTRRAPEAEVILRGLAAQAEAAYGPDDPLTLEVRHWLAFSLLKQSRFEEAAATFQDVHARRARVLGPGNIDTLRSGHHAGRSLIGLGDWAGAEPVLRDVLGRRRAVLGDGAFDVVGTSEQLGQVLVELGGRSREAIEILDPAHHASCTGTGLAAFRPILLELLQRALVQRALAGEDVSDEDRRSAVDRFLALQGDSPLAEQFRADAGALSSRLRATADRRDASLAARLDAVLGNPRAP